MTKKHSSFPKIPIQYYSKKEKEIINNWHNLIFKREDDLGRCFLWHTLSYREQLVVPVENEVKKTGLYQGELLFSPRTGGWYFVDLDIIDSPQETLTLTQKVCLTTWLIEERKKGFIPEITKNTLDMASKLKPIKTSEQAEKLLNFLVKEYSVGESIKIYTGHRDNINHQSIFDKELLLAHSESETGDELLAILAYLENQGLIILDQESTGGNVRLTLEGKIATEQVTNENSDQGFVAMWFDESMNNVSEAIKKGIEQAGYKAVRIDDVAHNKKIDDEIIAAIKRARFVVADFTHGKTGVRGGVYYEAGFAHGLGIEVIFTCQESIVEKIHFDTRQYNHITWTEEKLDDLTEQIAYRISATIDDGPHKEKHTSSTSTSKEIKGTIVWAGEGNSRQAFLLYTDSEGKMIVQKISDF